MSHAPVSPLGRLKLAVVPFLLLALSACASNFNSQVTRFASQLPAPQGQTFAVVADDPALAGGIEFGQYARLVEDQMTRQGYLGKGSPDRLDALVWALTDLMIAPAIRYVAPQVRTLG